MSRIRVLVLLVGLVSIFNFSNVNGQSPKKEMRAVWFTTVFALDWPGYKVSTSGSQTYTINEQKNQFKRMLDRLEAANLNTVFFQIRSECDAMYKSSFEPWSAYLVTDRVMASDFELQYDPLQFVIEECHKRGFELHAWLNPYRFESSAGKYAGKAGDYSQSHPEWVLEYSGKGTILDPGNPEVRQRIVDIVKEVVTNYDVDGIVFDDYFYAYGGTPTTLDQYSQNLHKPVGKNLHDWRRENVNKMVADVYGAIQDIKPWVTFGVSPFGIWTTNSSVASARGITLPSGITGLNAYQDIYCDPVAWLEEGTVDYISPQLYWPTTQTKQDYKKLAPWWSDLANRFGKHFYSSHNLDKVEASNYAPSLKSKTTSADFDYLEGLSMIEYQSLLAQEELKLAPTEYGLQIYWNRISDKNGAPGSVFFRTKNFEVKGFVQYLATHEFKNKALPPAVDWKNHAQKGSPTNLRLNGDFFEWDFSENDLRYVIYAIPNADTNNPTAFDKSENLLGISYTRSFDISSYNDLKSTHAFGVAVLDRYGNEFAPKMMTFPSSIVENDKAKLFSVYPNPVENTLNLQLPSGVTKIDIVSVTGKTVKSITNFSEESIDVRDLTTGVYFIKISNTNGHIDLSKFIKK